MWRHAKASISQYSRKKRFYAGYLAKHMFLKSCRNSNLNPLDEFFHLSSLLYNPTTPETVNSDVSDEVLTESSESEEDIESEIDFGYL